MSSIKKLITGLEKFKDDLEKIPSNKEITSLVKTLNIGQLDEEEDSEGVTILTPFSNVPTDVKVTGDFHESLKVDWDDTYTFSSNVSYFNTLMMYYGRTIFGLNPENEKIFFAEIEKEANKLIDKLNA